MAELKFYAGSSDIDGLSGSGLGFYGDAGFGASIRVGEWQGRTYVTNGAGTTQGVEAPNVKYVNAASGILGQAGSGIALTCIPNSQATLIAEFTHSTAVQVQSAQAVFYDRYSQYNAPSGLTFKAAEIIHPGATQDNSGSGDASWYTPAGSSVVLPLANSPGVSGFYAGNGSNSTWTDTTHRWHMAISASPDSIGSKTLAGLLVSVEYL